MSPTSRESRAFALAAGMFGVAVAAAAGALPGQGGSPSFVRRPDPLVVLRAEGVPELVARWPETAVGRLFLEPEVAAAAAKAGAWLDRELARRAATLRAAAELGVALEPWQVANLYTDPDPWRAFRFPLREVRSAELVAAQDAGGEAGYQPVSTALVLSCLPQHEGRWTRVFEDEARQLADAPWFDAQPGAKVGGFPAHLFRPPGGDEATQDFPSYEVAKWMLHLPGTFVWGTGQPETTGAVGPAPAGGAPGVALTMDLQQYVAMFERMGFGVPPEFRGLGFDGLKRLVWRGSFAGALVLDELEVELQGEPKGLVAALVTGTAPLPAQPLPEGAIAQLRVAVDLPVLIRAIDDLSGGDLAIAPAIRDDLLKGLDGGLALGVAAPVGGVIPRVYLSLGVADGDALDRALDELLRDRHRVVEYEGVPCRVIEVPGTPQGVLPALCRVDSVLHVAESGLTLRRFLKARADGGEAMDVGDAPLPEGPGEVLPGFDLRLDEVALYEAFRDTWLPLFALVQDEFRGAAALSRDDLPDVDVVAEHCGASRGVLRRDGDRYLVQHLGPLGGPEAAALLMTWAPILTTTMYDYSTEQVAKAVAQARLEVAWTALAAFREREQRWPKDLAELFAAERLAPDALLLPGDDLAEPFALAGGGEARSSFRYFATPAPVPDVHPAGMLLVEVRARPYERAMLAADGAVPEVYGEASSRPIDAFGR